MPTTTYPAWNARANHGLAQAARGIATAGTVHDDGIIVDWTVRDGIYREVITYPEHGCPSCGTMLPACNDPWPTHLCVPAGEPARSPMFDRDA